MMKALKKEIFKGNPKAATLLAKGGIENTLFDIYCTQQCTLNFWLECREYIDILVDFNPNVPDSETRSVYGHFVIDNENGETGVPTYLEYANLWRKTQIANPFEYDWTDWTKNDISYVFLVNDTLSQQLEIWGVDDATKSSWIYGWIKEFAVNVAKLQNMMLKDL